MIWQDLLVDRWVEPPALRRAAAIAIGVRERVVAVVDDPAQLATIPPESQVVLERTRQYRDFPLQLLVVLRNARIADQHDGLAGTLAVARRLASELDAAVLFAEGSLAPSEWFRARPSGEIDVVVLDAEETGDVDSYVFVSERPFPTDRPLARVVEASEAR